MSVDDIYIDEKKIHAIRDLPTSNTITEVRSFHSLTTLYKRFIKSFSSIVASIIDYLKKETFVQTEATDKSFVDIQEKLTMTLVLTLLNFEKPFEVEYDASGIGFGAMLLQEGRSIVIFSEELCEVC